MNTVFNADEVFEVAERIEINGSIFYQKAAQMDAPTPTRMLLMDLAAMEEKHRKTFADMRAHLGQKERGGIEIDPEGEAAAYLRAMADSRIFHTPPASFFTGNENIKDVLERAISLEKESIVFYVGMMDAVPAEMGKFRIADIIKEEMRHVTILSSELSARMKD